MRTFNRGKCYWLSLVLTILLSGCSQPFTIKQLAKGDIDFVADIHRLEITSLLTTLMSKLYKRNPKELYKTPNATIEERIDARY